MPDNPVMETVEKFYGKDASESELKATPTEQATPTDDVDVTNAAVQEPPEGSENLDKPVEVIKAADELEASDNEDKDVQYIELDGKEHTLDELRVMRDGHMMQSDYTKKTQTLADDRKTFKAESETTRENLLKTQTEVTEMRDQLAVLVAEDDVVDWVELKESDPEQYIELKEKADKRKAALEKVKADRQTPPDDPAFIATERAKLFAANPDWFDDDKKPTDTYKADAALMNKYSVAAGFTSDEFARMTNSHHLITILKAAKYDELQEKGRKIKSEREKVPVITKPRAKSKSDNQAEKPMHEVMYSNNAASG